MFNTHIYPRITRGELQSVLEWERHPSPPKATEPSCTRSQLLAYYDKGTRIARAHRYLRPDGTLGGWGRPDPKQVLLDGVLYWA